MDLFAATNADEDDGMMEVDVPPWLSVPEPDPAADLLASPPASLGAYGPVLLCPEACKGSAAATGV